MKISFRNSHKYSFIFLFIISRGFFSFGQPTEFNVTNYLVQDGLSSFNPDNIVQDRFGFIWVGTQDGLNRFDGKQFVVYDKSQGKENRLLHNHVKSLALQGDTLWVATAMGGLDLINTSNAKVVKSLTPENTRGMNAWIEDILFCGNEVWLGSYEGLLKISGPAFKANTWPVNPFQPKDDYEIRRIALYGDSLIFGGVEKFGLVVYGTKANRLLQTYPFATLLEKSRLPKNIKSLVVAHDTLLCGTRQGLFLFKILKGPGLLYIREKNHYPLSSIAVNHINRLSDGRWVISALDGMYVFNENWQLVKHYQTENSLLKDNLINASFEDRQKNLWVLSYKGLQKLTAPKPFLREFKPKNQNAFFENPNRIHISRDSLLLIASWGGFFAIDLPSGKGLAIKNLPQQVPYYDIVESNAHIMVSGLAGNFYLDRAGNQMNATRISNQPGFATTDHPFIFCTHLPFDSTTFMFGSEFAEGLLVRQNGRENVYTTKTKELKLTDNSINKLFKDANGKLWCLHDKSIDIIDWKAKTIKSVFPATLPSAPDASVFFDVAEMGGKIRVATYGGGIFYTGPDAKSWAVFNSNNGLCNNAVYTLTPENDSILWASTNIGLSRINIHSLSVNNYFSRSDNNPMSFDERSAFATRDKLYFGGPDGIVEVNKKAIQTGGAKPQIWVRSVSYLHGNKRFISSDLNQNQIQIPYASSDIRLTFSSIDFTQPELNQFAYRLQKNSPWISLGNKPEFVLSGLLPGSHLLEIKGTNSNGDWLSNPIQYTITVPPPWYKTSWFFALCAIATAAIAYGLYRYRLAQVHKEYRFKEKMAADLHDDLGSTITGIKMFTELGASTGSPQYYAPVKEGLTEAALALREMIWVLDPKTNTLADVVHKLETNVRPLLAARQIALLVKLDHRLGGMPLKTDNKRGLYLLLKEFVNNSIKYSGCNQISLEVVLKGNSPSITIADNGAGFDFGQVSRGNGLTNMENRARQAGLEPHWATAPGRGVILLLEKP